MTAISPLIN